MHNVPIVNLRLQWYPCILHWITNQLMYKKGCQLGQKELNERRKMAMQPTNHSHPHHKTLDYDTTRRIYAILMVTLQSSSNWEPIDVSDRWNWSVRIEWTTTDSNRADDHLPLFPKNRFATRAATYMPIQLHPCSLHQIPDWLMYQTGCGIGQKVSNERKGTAIQQTKALSHLLTKNRSATRAATILIIFILIAVCVHHPHFVVFFLMRCLHRRHPPSLCIGWDRQIDIKTTKARDKLLLCFLDHCPKISYQRWAVGGDVFSCMLHRTISSLVPTFDEFCADVVRDALLQQCLYGVVNTSSVEHDAVKCRGIRRKNSNPYWIKI